MKACGNTSSATSRSSEPGANFKGHALQMMRSGSFYAQTTDSAPPARRFRCKAYLLMLSGFLSTFAVMTR